MAWEIRLRAALAEPAFGLSALRIAVVVALLASPELHAAKSLAASPELLVASPEGLGWLAGVRLSPELVGGIRVLAISAAALALLGYWARLSCAVLLLSATFLISFAQRAGAVLHDMHLLWLLAVLASSRCADVWALDAWGKPAPAPSLAYGAPLCAARALLGVVYFFPGFHKLLSGGLGWGAASNVKAMLYGKWFQHGQLPAVRIDGLPDWLLTLGGLSVLGFELSFVVLALWPRTRLVALGLGLWFHLSTQVFFFIGFWGLVVCYVVLVPWQRVLGRFGRAAEAATAPGEAWPWPSLGVGGLLLLATTIQGVRGQTQAFPFACYPKFERVADTVAPDLIVEVVRADGSVLRLERDFAWYRTQREWGRVYYLLGAYGGQASAEQLRSFAVERAEASAARAALESATKLRLLAADYSTRPADWGKPPLRVRLLRELPASDG